MKRRRLILENFHPRRFKFVPLEGELIVEYLKKKLKNEPLPPNKIKEVTLYKYSPEELEDMYGKNRRETDMFFFTQRDLKHQNGSRLNRNTGSGYWKASTADKSVMHEGKQVGFKKTLVFYRWKTDSKHAEKTNWIMHEFRVDDLPPNKKCSTDMKLDWVLCRIHLRIPKSGNESYQIGEEHQSELKANDNANDEPMHQDSDNNEWVDSLKVEIPEPVASTSDVFESLDPICFVPSFSNIQHPGPQNSFMDFPQPSSSMAVSIYADEFQTPNPSSVEPPQNSFTDFPQPSSNMASSIYGDDFQTLYASYEPIIEMEPLSSVSPLQSSMNPFEFSYMGNQNQNMCGSTSTSPFQDDIWNFGYPRL